MKSKLAILITLLVPALLTPHAEAQTRMNQQAKAPAPEHHQAYEFLNPYGIQNFSEHYIDALSTLLHAESLYITQQYQAAHDALEELWSQYPTGSLRWNQLPSQPFGINLGTPPNYYALRMLTDTVQWRLDNPKFNAAARTAQLTVVLPGMSNGIEPRTIQELQQNTGIQVQHTLEPLLLEQDSKVIHDSLRLFSEYVLAITQGNLEIEVQIVHLSDLNVSVAASVGDGRNFATLSDISEIWEAIDPAVMAQTDWWWVMYPSHVPEQYPDFEDAEFITGGMGTGPDSGSPCFIADDRWLVRKPPHLGNGAYSDIEREVYAPQWLQHEFFHHLFRIYSEFGLEAESHQWFDRSTWPADFVGRYEPDYYHEALYKRLQGADTPLVSALRYASSGGVVSLSDIAGFYIREPAQNNWHLGSIQISPKIEWLNYAGVRWSLQDDLANGNLLTGPDCPYFGTWGGNRFVVEWERDALGDQLDTIKGFRFNGESYRHAGP